MESPLLNKHSILNDPIFIVESDENLNYQPNRKTFPTTQNLLSQSNFHDKTNSLPNIDRSEYFPKSPDRKKLQDVIESCDALLQQGSPKLEVHKSLQDEEYAKLGNIVNDLNRLSLQLTNKYNLSHTSNGKSNGVAPIKCDLRRMINNHGTMKDKFRKNDDVTITWSDEKNSPSSPSSPGEDNLFLGSKNRFRKKNTKYPRRAVLKNGECNVLQKNRLGHSRLRYLQDIFTTLVDIQWRWTLLIFSLSFMGSWLFYAGIYWLISFAHGDFEHSGEDGWTPCIENIFGFTSAFLFSVETQHTIGYGGRSTNEECPEAVFIMCVQSITGVMISAFMAGIFFAKMARPKQRRQTLLFSRRAVICQRDGRLCLMFRVGDMRKSHIIGTGIRAHIFHTRTTREGEKLMEYQSELAVTADGCESDLLFLWPLTVVHVIDKDSPLYTISAQELMCEKFEIVAVLEGTVESTGQTTQARSSYIPCEIKWGHRFEPLVSYNEDRQGYEIDYKKFNDTVKVATPLCSARDLDELYLIHSELADCQPNNHGLLETV